MDKSERLIKDFIALGEKMGHVFIATADQKGVPHIASSGKIGLTPEGRVEISEWFCPVTLSNLQQKPILSLVAWDFQSDRGYQLIGEAEKIEETSMMDGYIPASENTPSIPQVERKILLKVKSLLPFTMAPHADMEYEAG